MQDTVTASISADGFIIREETVIPNNSDGILSYTVSNGAAVEADSDIAKVFSNEKDAVACGYWQLYRYNPLLAAEGGNPFTTADEMLKELEKIECEETIISDDARRENINDARTVIIKADPSHSGDTYREKSDLEKARKKRRKIIHTCNI